MSKPKFTSFNTLTFDVVGTLIDFETGILEWFRPTLESINLNKSDEEILTEFAKCEGKYQRKAPDKPFTAMLPLIYQDIALRWNMNAGENEAIEFQRSIQNWPAFPDTIAALGKLKSRFRLVAC